MKNIIKIILILLSILISTFFILSVIYTIQLNKISEDEYKKIELYAESESITIDESIKHHKLQKDIYTIAMCKRTYSDQKLSKINFGQELWLSMIAILKLLGNCK